MNRPQEPPCRAVVFVYRNGHWLCRKEAGEEIAPGQRVRCGRGLNRVHPVSVDNGMPEIGTAAGPGGRNSDVLTVAPDPGAAELIGRLVRGETELPADPRADAKAEELPPADDGDSAPATHDVDGSAIRF